MKKPNKRKKVVQFTKDDFIVLNYEELLKVNGAKGGGQSGPSGGPSPSSSPTSNNTSTTSSSSSSGKGGSSSGQSSSSSEVTNTTPKTSNSSSSIDELPSNTIVVKPGDTLGDLTWSYNKEHGTKYTATEVAKMNGIQNPNLIEVGQKITFGKVETNSTETTTIESKNQTTNTNLVPGATNVVNGTSTSTTYEKVNYEQQKHSNQPNRFNQRDFNFDGVSKNFGETACAATSLLNEVSEQYTKETGKKLTKEQADKAMLAAVKTGHINSQDATVNSYVNAANAMSKELGLKGKYSDTSDINKASVVIYAVDSKPRPAGADHFVNSVGSNNTNYYDPWAGTIGKVSSLPLDENRPIRLLEYSDKE